NAPTDSTIGQSARRGHVSRRNANNRTNEDRAEQVARPAASHTGVLAVSPILMIGHDRPNSTTVAASWSQATFIFLPNEVGEVSPIGDGGVMFSCRTVIDPSVRCADTSPAWPGRQRLRSPGLDDRQRHGQAR